KRNSIATMKSIGATGASIVAMYLIEILLLALVGIVVGVAMGALLPFAVLAAFGQLIPVPVFPSLYPGALMLAVGYGILTTLAFALWPLGRAHDVRASALFRDEVAPARVAPRLPYVIGTALAAIALAAFAIVAAYDRWIALIFVLSAVVVV